MKRIKIDLYLLMLVGLSSSLGMGTLLVNIWIHIIAIAFLWALIAESIKQTP